MKPAHFPQANQTKENAKREQPIENIPYYRDGDTILCSWRTIKILDRIKFLWTGRVWILIGTKTDLPPIFVNIDNPIKKDEK